MQAARLSFDDEDQHGTHRRQGRRSLPYSEGSDAASERPPTLVERVIERYVEAAPTPVKNLKKPEKSDDAAPNDRFAPGPEDE